MSELELLQRTALAAAIGLLIGIERGWQEREARDGARVAGIRTFTLIGTLGAICSLFSGPGGVALGFCFLAFALPFGLFNGAAPPRRAASRPPIWWPACSLLRSAPTPCRAIWLWRPPPA